MTASTMMGNMYITRNKGTSLAKLVLLSTVVVFSISVRMEEFLLIKVLCMCCGFNEGCVTEADMKGDVSIFV